jgi:hypothetical protein
MAANVSKETTVKEVMSIAGFKKDEFKLENINLMFGPVNAVSYCTNMFDFPTLEHLQEEVTKELHTTVKPLPA